MNKVSLNEINNKNAVIVVIDAQESILSATIDWQRILNRMKFLLSNALLFDVPIVFTEQYPKGLGNVLTEIISLMSENATIIPKMEFNCFDNKEFEEHIHSFPSLKYLILVGVETHICVLQTALGSLEKNLIPIIISDATSSRKKNDYDVALNLFNQYNIPVLTTEILSYLFTKTAQNEKFKDVLSNVKKFN